MSPMTSFCPGCCKPLGACACQRGLDTTFGMPSFPEDRVNDSVVDGLEDAFERQRTFMDELVAADRLPSYPVDLRSKNGQRMIKEIIHNMCEEAFEASFTMKNRAHRLTDDKTFDEAHYLEEIGDTFAYFVEWCIMSGISAERLYEEFKRKNKIVRERLRKGY